MARDEPRGYTLGKDVVKQVLKDGSGIELARAADSRVLKQVLVHFIAQKIQDIEPQATVLHKAPVTNRIFQPANEQELKEHHRVKRGLAGVAVERLRLLVEEVPVQQLG